MAKLPAKQLEEIKSIFELQKTQQSSAPPIDFKERKRRLKLIYNAMFDYRDDFIKAIQKDFKKSSLETITTELFVVTSEAKYAIKNLKKWMKPRKGLCFLISVGIQILYLLRTQRGRFGYRSVEFSGQPDFRASEFPQ